jgi:hypothetical protein
VRTHHAKTPPEKTKESPPRNAAIHAPLYR